MEDNRTIEAFPDWSRQGCLDAVVLIACSSSTDVRARGYRCLAITTPIDRSPHLLTSVVSLDRGRLPTVLTAALGTNPPSRTSLAPLTGAPKRSPSDAQRLLRPSDTPLRTR
ncbi:uncharacterized protein PSFLO_01442 [Pseudozyma flocculosa]|uniref:Uncharacterized protein n=1 Tax=Pseudozyma flocculosa TaxID=84751 RepID=A0A5C3EY44_9BASI|nr:uncharacterized protein PSFLO_01442 [Pseudozyma flocculosa]